MSSENLNLGGFVLILSFTSRWLSSLETSPEGTGGLCSQLALDKHINNLLSHVSRGSVSQTLQQLQTSNHKLHHRPVVHIVDSLNPLFISGKAQDQSRGEQEDISE